MISKISRWSIIVGISLGLVLRVAPPANADRTITCESRDNRYRFCRVDTRGGVRLSKQLSDTSCRQGRSWGYDRDGIWVDNGCRAQFTVRSNNNNNSGSSTAAIVGTAVVVGAIASAIASNSNNNNNSSSSSYTITCGSQNNNYTRCSANTNGRVYLRRQLSKNGCWEGDTWGYDRDGIWVDNGCRGEFEIRR